MAINKYNDLTSTFSNPNNNNYIDTTFVSQDQLSSSCLSYYVSDDHMYGTKNNDLGTGPNECSTLLDLIRHGSGRVMGPQVVVDPSPTSSVLIIPGDSSSEVLNTGPTTPNSISISSSSPEPAAIEGLPNEDGGDQSKDGDDNKSKKLLKAKKKEKKKKEPRFAFMTKTDVDQLDDGYRWRKYGQKAVKNSPFPRNYYRCTTAACGVKKRVERSCEDPSIVVTTYEGQHDHPCPIMTRGGFGFGFGFGFGIGTGAGAGMGNGSFPSQPQNQCSTAPIVFGGNSAATSSTSHDFFPYSHDKYHQQHQFTRNYTQFYNPNCSRSLRMFTVNDGGDSGDGNSSSTICSMATTTISCDGDGSGGVNIVKQSNPFVNSFQLRHIRPPYSASNSHHQPRDDGLLQDIVPSQMRNESTREV